MEGYVYPCPSPGCRDTIAFLHAEVEALKTLLRRANDFVTYSSEFWPTKLEADIQAALAAGRK